MEMKDIIANTISTFEFVEFIYYPYIIFFVVTVLIYCYEAYKVFVLDPEVDKNWRKILGKWKDFFINPFTVIVIPVLIGSMFVSFLTQGMEKTVERKCMIAIVDDRRIEYAELMRALDDDPKLEVDFGKYGKILEHCRGGDAMKLIRGE